MVPRYAVCTARPRLVCVYGVRSVRDASGQAACASGTYITQEAGTFQHRGEPCVQLVQRRHVAQARVGGDVLGVVREPGRAPMPRRAP